MPLLLYRKNAGNIYGANKLCTEELLKDNVNIGEGISQITSFDKEKSIEGNNFAYYIYNIIRTSSTEPKSDLESLTIKVEKIKDQYLINGVKSQSKKELFVDGKYLRILEQMNGLELLILRILQNPSEFNRQNGEKIKDPNAPTPGYRNLIIYTRTYFFIEMLSELLNAAQEDVAESIYYLESNRLIVDNVSLSKLQTNGHPIRTLEDKLTSKGKDLIAFIIR